MNEKIENLIEELKSECQKQSVSIICTAQKEGELKSIIYGETTEILLCLAMQEEHLDDNFPVPAHIVRRIAVDAYKVEFEAIGRISVEWIYMEYTMESILKS
ncbi:hypothetical protein ACKPC0_000079 [Enterococcus hirae]